MCLLSRLILSFSLPVEIRLLCQPPKSEATGGFTGFGGSLPAAVCQPAVQGNNKKVLLIFKVFKINYHYF